MEPRTLDLAAYPRRAHFDYFRQMANPYLSVTASCDITALRRLTQERGLPFFLTVLHCAINAANAVPELRQRIRGEGIVEYDRCLSSHTVALPDGTYCYCTLDCAQPLGAFLPAAQAEVARVKAAPSLDDGADPDELFFVSSLPWLTFSAISLPTPTPADSNPRITFGKFTQEGDRVLLPVNLTANHALVDGLHLAAFLDGTLFDTVPANQAAYAVALAPYGVSLSVEDFALHCNGRYYRDFLGELLGGDEAKIDAVHDAKLAAYPALFHRIRENTALFSLLQTLRADYHTALVTSATRCSVEAILRYFHRENCFDLLLTNVEVPHKKPAPDGFLMAMEHFGVAPADTIIFEDSPEGIQAAQASGAPYLLVREIR